MLKSGRPVRWCRAVGQVMLKSGRHLRKVPKTSAKNVCLDILYSVCRPLSPYIHSPTLYAVQSSFLQLLCSQFSLVLPLTVGSQSCGQQLPLSGGVNVMTISYFSLRSVYFVEFSL